MIGPVDRDRVLLQLVHTVLGGAPIVVSTPVVGEFPQVRGWEAIAAIIVLRIVWVAGGIQPAMQIVDLVLGHGDAECDGSASAVEGTIVPLCT